MCSYCSYCLSARISLALLTNITHQINSNPTGTIAKRYGEISLVHELILNENFRLGIPDKSQTNAGLNNLRDALRRGEWKSCEKPLLEISNELVALSGRGEALSKERNAFVSSMKVLLESSSVSSSSKTFFQCAGHLLMKLQSPA